MTPEQQAQAHETQEEIRRAHAAGRLHPDLLRTLARYHPDLEALDRWLEEHGIEPNAPPPPVVESVVIDAAGE